MASVGTVREGEGFVFVIVLCIRKTSGVVGTVIDVDHDICSINFGTAASLSLVDAGELEVVATPVVIVVTVTGKDRNTSPTF